MRYKPYRVQKSSEIGWIGDYPSHWHLTRVKFEAYVKARVGWHGLKSDDLTEEGPYLITGTDFQSSNINWSNCYHCDIFRYKQDPYIQLKNGDLLITKDGTIGKLALVSGLLSNEYATLNSGIFVTRPLKSNFHPEFYFWLLQSSVFIDFVNYNKTGSTIVHLYQDTFVNFSYASPEINEQYKISLFLFHETAKIDSLIEKQQQLIELLKEKRQAVISHAVTKGLNPDVPMKDSGVEWLGEIPNNWNICLLKHMAAIKNGQDYKFVQADNGYPVMGSGGQFTYASKFIYNKPSVLLGRKGTIDKPLYINEPFWTVDTMYYTILNNDIDAKYLYYLALTIQFSKYATNTALPSMTQENLSNYVFAIPPSKLEREKIRCHLDNVTAKVDRLLDVQQRFIFHLKERRTALISAAVTGKIDVRHWRAPDEQTAAEAEAAL